MSRASALCPPHNEFSQTTTARHSSRQLCRIERKKVARRLTVHLRDVDRAHWGPRQSLRFIVRGWNAEFLQRIRFVSHVCSERGLFCVLGQKRGASSVLSRRSHANRGSNAHKLTGGSVSVLGRQSSQQGESLGAPPTLILIGRASRCSADAHFKRRSLSVLHQSSFQKVEPLGARPTLILIGRTSQCSTKAHFDRWSLSVLSRRSFQKAEPLGAQPTLISKGRAFRCSTEAHFNRQSLPLSCFLPFTLYPFWTGVRVKGNPYPVTTW